MDPRGPHHGAIVSAIRRAKVICAGSNGRNQTGRWPVNARARSSSYNVSPRVHSSMVRDSFNSRVSPSEAIRQYRACVRPRIFSERSNASFPTARTVRDTCPLYAAYNHLQMIRAIFLLAAVQVGFAADDP